MAVGDFGPTLNEDLYEEGVLEVPRGPVQGVEHVGRPNRGANLSQTYRQLSRQAEAGPMSMANVRPGEGSVEQGGPLAGRSQSVDPNEAYATQMAQQGQYDVEGHGEQPISQVKDWMDMAGTLRETIAGHGEVLSQVGDWFTMRQILDGENLSPEARLQLDQMTQNKVLAVARTNEAIKMTQQKVESWDRIFANAEGRSESTTQTAKNMLSGGMNSDQGGAINPTTDDTGAKVQQKAEGAMAKAVAQVQGGVRGTSPEVWNLVPGGAETDATRARNAENMQNSMITLRNSVRDDSGLSSGGGSGDRLSSNQESAINEAANAQLDYLGVANETERMKMEGAFKFAMANEITNMVRQRSDLEREYDQSVAAIQLDEQRRIEGDSVAFDLDPAMEREIAMEDFVQDALEKQFNFNMTSIEEEEFQQISQAWLRQPEGNRMGLLQSTVVGQRLIDEVGEENLGQVAKFFEQGGKVGEAKYKQLTDFSNLPRFEPGSDSTKALLHEAALGAGLSPEQAAEIAGSNSMHQMLKLRSKDGKVGGEKGGNLKGLWGIPEDVLNELGYDWRQIRNDPLTQTQIFLTYIDAKYNSDPVGAMNDYVQNKELTWDDFKQIGAVANSQANMGSGSPAGEFPARETDR